MSEVTLQIPASTSNCGPGFDTLSIALQLYGFVRVALRGDGNGVQPVSPEEQSPQTLRMANEAAGEFADAVGRPRPAFTYDIWGEVPIARGLGSSAIVVGGILKALNLLHGEPLAEEELIRLSARLDNAPDNSAAAFRGGFCVSRTDPQTGHYAGSLRFEVGNELALVTIAPDTPVLTSIAREALPRELPFADAVRSLNSAACITAIFASGEYSRLAHAMSDYIHQPYRERINPGAREAIAAGIAAGAWTGWLSGSGSAVVCAAPREAALDVGKAMAGVFDESGVRNRLFKLKADNTGMRVVT